MFDTEGYGPSPTEVSSTEQYKPVILPIFPLVVLLPAKPATCAPKLPPMMWKSSSLAPVCATRNSISSAK